MKGDVDNQKKKEEKLLTDNYALKSRNRRLEEANQDLKSLKTKNE